MNKAELNRVSQVLAEPAPPPNKDGTPAPWEFADDPAWMEFIDRMSLADIEQLFREGLHQASVQRMRDALGEVGSRFIGRQHAFEMMVACAVAQTNMVYLGPPGTAKSLMVRSFSDCLGVRSQTVPIRDEEQEVKRLTAGNRQDGRQRRMFEYLLTRYTTPEELFGGTDIQVLLSAGVACRRTTGLLPQAEVAFLDEIFKANSAILNTLLSITNERIFYNMGLAFKVNMAFVVGASNETPDEDELGALFDRFPVRVPCHAVPEALTKEVIDKAFRFDVASRFRESKRDIPRKACLNDLRLLSKVTLGAAFGGPDPFGGNAAFEDEFMDLYLAIRRNYGVSDRTPSQVLRLCRALALLDQSDPQHLGSRHLRAWGYVGAKMDELDDLARFVHSRIVARDHEAQEIKDGLFDKK